MSRLKPGDLTPGERLKVVENGTDAVFTMCLEIGFFHADPHPGNIFALRGGHVCFIDCGMTGHIEQRTQQQLGDLVVGVLYKDLDKVIKVALELTDADVSMENNRAFRADAWEIVSQFQVDSLEALDVTGLLDRFFELLRKYRLRCPSDLVFLIKALTTIQSVGREIEPTFDVVRHVQPLLTRLVQRQYGLPAIRSRLRRSLANYVELVEEMPDELRVLIKELRRRDFIIGLEHKGLDTLSDTVERAATYIAIALILAALLVGSSTLIAGERSFGNWDLFSVVGAISFFVATVFSIGLLVTIFRRRGR